MAVEARAQIAADPAQPAGVRIKASVAILQHFVFCGGNGVDSATWGRNAILIFDVGSHALGAWLHPGRET